MKRAYKVEMEIIVDDEILSDGKSVDEFVRECLKGDPFYVDTLCCIRRISGQEAISHLFE